MDNAISVSKMAVCHFTLIQFFDDNFVEMSRGCSWEYGFMTKQLSYTPIFEQNAMWIFCDTAL